MKDSLLHPVVFLLLMILCGVFFALGYLLYLWDIQYVPSDPPTLAWAVGLVPSTVRSVFIPATITAFFLVIVRIARRPGVPFLSFLLPAVFCAAVLYLGIIGLNRVLGPPLPPAPRLYDPLAPQHLNVVGQKTIFPINDKGDAVAPALVVDPAENPAFSVEQAGSFDPSTWTAIFQRGKLTVPIVPRNPNFSRVMAPRAFFTSLIEEMSALTMFLENARNDQRANFLIAIGGVALFSAACIGFAWLTRWPLLNVFVVAISFRGLFWLFTLFSTKVATDAFALVLPKSYLGVAPAVGLGALAVIFLVWNVFFIRPPVRN